MFEISSCMKCIEDWQIFEYLKWQQLILEWQELNSEYSNRNVRPKFKLTEVRDYMLLTCQTSKVLTIGYIMSQWNVNLVWRCKAACLLYLICDFSIFLNISLLNITANNIKEY